VLLGAAAILFFAYWGLETAIAASGEVRNPERAIPKGIVAAIAFTTVYYLAYSVSVYHMVPWEFVAGYVSMEPNSSVLALYGFVLPSYAILFVSFALVISVLSDIFPLMLSASRIVFAWSFDGLIPKAFAKLNSHGVPSLALVLSYAVSFGSALECNYSGYLRVLDLATLGMLWTYILVALTILTASVERPLILKNAKFRLGRLTRPVAVLAFLTCLVLFGEFILDSRNSFFFFVIWSAVGATVYYWIQQRKLREKVDMQATFALIPPE
jgi:amino acid transporter